MYISQYFTQLLTNFKQNLKSYILNISETDNSCYLIIDCSLEEVLKTLPLQIQEKILLLEYPSEKFSFTKEKDSLIRVF